MEGVSLLQDEAYNELKQMIRDGVFEIGRIYSVNDIAKRLNISKTPVRDAVMKLSREDMLEILPSRGFRMKKYSEQDIVELYQLRCALEGYCGEVLAVRYQGDNNMEEVENLRIYITELEEAAASGAEVSEILEIDLKFHKEIIMNVMNDRIKDIMFNNIRCYRDMARKSLTYDEGYRETLKEHRAILAAIESGDPSAARKAIIHHIETPLRYNVDDYGEFWKNIREMFPEMRPVYV